jgi:predicted acylesterase/phospholipase RssA
MENTTVKPTGIVAKIMAFLNLGDAGKLQSFFDREIKKKKREIEAYQKSIENEKYNSKGRLETLAEQEEDAAKEVDDAYFSVKPDDVKTNAEQEAFASTYWDKIERAETKLADIQDDIEQEKESTADKIEYFEEQIKERQARIAKLTAE